MEGEFIIEPLSRRHDREAFCCGVEALDAYLKNQAGQDMRRHVSNCFVATDAENGAVAAYYTLAAASIPLSELSHEQVKRLPRYPVLPAALIGRLAVDRRYRGIGLGGALLLNAAKRAESSDAAVYALIVDAKDETAERFYVGNGFRALASNPRRLFLPIETARRSLGE